MRWTWPAWTAIALGGVALACGLAFLAAGWDANTGREITVGLYLFLGGAVLLAGGLHALQSAYSSCGDCCWDGCECDHCPGCAGDDCCGQCSCCGPAGNGQDPHTPTTAATATN